MPASAAAPGAELLELTAALDAFDVDLSSVALAYTLTECVKYGGEDIFGFENSACVKRRCRIGLEGLEVVKVRRRGLFFGENAVVVRGDVRRTVLEGLEKTDAADRSEIKGKLEAGETAPVPVRRGVSPEVVAALLRRLAR